MAACEKAQLDLSTGRAALESSGEEHLYGIPTDRLTGLRRFGLENEGMMLTVLAKGGNCENAVRLTRIFVEDCADEAVTPD